MDGGGVSSIYLKWDSLHRTLPWIETEDWLSAAAGRGPSRARVLGRAAVAAGLAARARSAINKQAKIARIILACYIEVQIRGRGHKHMGCRGKRIVISAVANSERG